MEGLIKSELAVMSSILRELQRETETMQENNLAIEEKLTAIEGKLGIPRPRTSFTVIEGGKGGAE